MVEPSEYIVFVDESGTPVTNKPDPGFPIFSLQFVLIRKDAYSHQVVPELIAFKLKHHGSDSTILHGKKIDAKDGEFRMLQDSAVFSSYVADLDIIIGNAQMQLFSAYFLHHEVAALSSLTVHPYAYFMHVLLSEIEAKIAKKGVKTICRVVVESRPVARFCLDQNNPGLEWATVSTKVSVMLNLTAEIPFRLGSSPLL